MSSPAHTASASPTPPAEVAERFLATLQLERAAACHADLDALIAIQEQKRALLPELRSAKLDEQVRASLQKLAQRNLVLLRQLVQCYAALHSEGADPTYDAQGQCQPPEARALRGRL